MTTTKVENRLCSPLILHRAKRFLNIRTLRGIVSLIGFVVLWQLVVVFKVPYLHNLPYPAEVAETGMQTLGKKGYWLNWGISLKRIFAGFIIAQLVGIPLGLAMGTSRVIKDLTFPAFEMLRPIPPIAWIPLAILFWPTPEMSIYFLTFIGAFFIVVINVLQGVTNIPVNLKRAAASLGAKPSDIFWKIMVPGSLPSIITGMTVGMGVTWNVLIAAEMIAGRGGLGRMTWEAYTNNALPTIIIGMISIGAAGYLCSSLIRALGDVAMPWKKRF
ncbi:MAG: ABC transporter permease [Bacillota bacterium]